MLFPNKQCSWDMIPAALLKENFNVFSPIFLPVVNFHSCNAQVLVYVLLMTPTLEPVDLSNYHPLSTLIFWLVWEGFIWHASQSITRLLVISSLYLTSPPYCKNHINAASAPSLQLLFNVLGRHYIRLFWTPPKLIYFQCTLHQQ